MWVTVSASSSSPSSSVLPLSPESQVGLKPGPCSESETQKWSCLSASLWRMTKSLAALGASCAAADVQLGLDPGRRLSQCRSWTCRYSRRLLLHLYLYEGGRRHTEQETPTSVPSFPSSFGFFPSLPLSIYYYLIMQKSYSSSVFKYSATDKHV